MKRRHFLGAVSAASIGLVFCRTVNATPLPDLDWKSETIQTIGQAPKFRAPVVTAVALNRDQTQLAVVGDDHFVNIYSLESGRFAQTLRGHTDWVRVAVFSSDGSTLLTGGNDRRCLLWDTRTWDSPYQLTEHPSAIIEADFNPVNQTVALVGFESKLRIYDLATKQQVEELDCPCEDMRCVAYSKDGQRLAAGGRNGTIRVWETATGKLIADLKAHRQRIHSVDFLPNGDIVSGSEDQFVRCTNPETQKVTIELPRFTGKLFDVVVIDDQRIATGGSDNVVSIWDLAKKTKTGSLTGHTGTVSCLCSGSSLLISGSYDTQVRIWHRETNTSQPDRHTQNSDGWNLKLK